MDQTHLPTSIGPYSVVRRLGQGGAGEVFLAHRFGASGFVKKVAIKTLQPAHRGNAQLDGLLITEARIGAGLSHRNLIQVLDLGTDSGTYYVVMEYVEGRDLASLIGVSRPPLPVVLSIAEEVLTALDYLHTATDDAGRSLGLVHRDLSTANVLVSRSGEVKLADLGLTKATLLADQTWSRLTKGTIGSMSPEQLAGQPVTPRSDQFAFGVLLVELSTGQRPFDGASFAATLTRIQAGAPSLAAVPPPLVEIVRRTLEVDPEQRYPNARDLLVALRQAGIDLRPAGTPEIQDCARACLAHLADRH